MSHQVPVAEYVCALLMFEAEKGILLSRLPNKKWGLCGGIVYPNKQPQEELARYVWEQMGALVTVKDQVGTVHWYHERRAIAFACVFAPEQRPSRTLIYREHELFTRQSAARLHFARDMERPMVYDAFSIQEEWDLVPSELPEGFDYPEGVAVSPCGQYLLEEIGDGLCRRWPRLKPEGFVESSFKLLR